MLRIPGKAYKIAKKILKQENVKVNKPKEMEKTKLTGPYLQH